MEERYEHPTPIGMRMHADLINLLVRYRIPHAAIGQVVYRARKHKVWLSLGIPTRKKYFDKYKIPRSWYYYSVAYERLTLQCKMPPSSWEKIDYYKLQYMMPIVTKENCQQLIDMALSMSQTGFVKHIRRLKGQA